MSLLTKSTFYYGGKIDNSNKYLSFNEGGPEITASLINDDYTLEELMDEAARALNEVGSLTYTVSMDRTTRYVTISATGTFSLLVGTGSTAASSVFLSLGFTGSNRTGSASYIGDSGAGTEFTPQFYLQSYMGVDDNYEALDGQLRESASGVIQITSFGSKRYMKCKLEYITNEFQASGSPIDNNTTGVDDSRAFLVAMVQKQKCEFMPDISNRNIYDKLLLESTSSDRKGLGFNLKAMYGRGLPTYFETGTITFREV